MYTVCLYVRIYMFSQYVCSCTSMVVRTNMGLF